MPKVIIVEGVDNCGKDTLIENLKGHFNKTKVIHSSAPDSDNLFLFYYNGIIHDTLKEYYSKEYYAIIHNRSMYGEYVYGPKYRNEDKHKVMQMINRLELGRLKSFICEDELYLVLLTSDNVDLLVNHDDGKSISNKCEDILSEIKLFDEVFCNSTISNKIRITVNDGNKFKPKEEICSEVIKFIEN